MSTLKNESKSCGGCLQAIDHSGHLTCSLCGQNYDLHCAGVTAQCFGALTGDRRAAWSCAACKSRQPKTDNTETPARAGEGGVTMRRGASRPPAMDMELDEEAGGNNAAVGARIDAVEARMEAAERRRAEAGPDGAEGLRRTVEELKLELNERDQEALLADLEIGQLPEQKGENPVHAVIVLATRLGVPLEERDVVFAERVGAPPAEAGGRARRVVVRLARRHLRDELLRAARVRRAVTAEGGGRVFINERLTRPNRQLFHRVREECHIRVLRVAVEHKPDLSRHCMLLAEFKLKKEKPIPRWVIYRPLKNILLEQLNLDLNAIKWENYKCIQSVNQLVGALTASVRGLMDLHAPLKRQKFKHPPHPWLTDTIRAMMRTRDIYHKKYKVDNTIALQDSYSTGK
ncbi:hypothetical protein ABMA27_009189 [Loxostege sticticalis]|uniref:PHD-type domain-containing protein n=1 Tax=Loxostege sticticalis TaxID=481309 RepID=A0ABR3HA84_LOXSC